MTHELKDLERFKAWVRAGIQSHADHAIELANRTQAAEASVARVRELHTRTYVSVDNEVWGRDPRCSECHDAYPCPTIRALAGAK